MNRTKIEWVAGPNGQPGYTWNPIKGKCPVGCWYCYARKMYKRFGLSPEIKLDHPDNDPQIKEKPCRIFVCSTFEVFHPSADKYRDEIFNVIQAHVLFKSKATFIILTKMPERIDRPMPDNVWLGVSVTGKDGDDDRIRMLCNDSEDRVKFVSFEPLLGDVATKMWNAFPEYIDALSWVIIGRLTGHGHRFDPTQANIKRIYQECRNVGIPVFLKDNLRGLWKGPFVQEFPMEMCA